jgi:ABC-2 type transport system ATP-binding protein
MSRIVFAVRAGRPGGRPVTSRALLVPSNGYEFTVSFATPRWHTEAVTSPLAVHARGLTKRYGSVTALDGLDLDVVEGTVLGLLGPNGAGKTTAVSILTTLLVPDSGTATVAGADVLREPQRVRERIGLSGQYAAVDEVLTGRENLVMVGRLYRLSAAQPKQRADELLERFALVDAANRPVKGYSGGMRRRLDLAAALVAAPPVLFLDEPTTGLDPRSRIDLWQVIRELVADGATLLLTTQYLEEADQLADEIVVIDHGRAIAKGTSDELKGQVGQERLQLVLVDDVDLERARHVIAGALAVRVDDVEMDVASKTLSTPAATGLATLTAAAQALDSATVRVADIGLRRPTLDDVFLTLTGHAATDGDADGAGSAIESGRRAKNKKGAV